MIRFAFPEDTQRKHDLAGRILKLRREINKRRENPDALVATTRDMEKKLEGLETRLIAWQEAEKCS